MEKFRQSLGKGPGKWQWERWEVIESEVNANRFALRSIWGLRGIKDVTKVLACITRLGVYRDSDGERDRRNQSEGWISQMNFGHVILSSLLDIYFERCWLGSCLYEVNGSHLFIGCTWVEIENGDPWRREFRNEQRWLRMSQRKKVGEETSCVNRHVI